MASEEELSQTNKLIAYLASLEFKGEKLERELRKKIALNQPSFKIDHKTVYGEETMFFDLEFKRDQQFNGYRLDRYRARHRSQIIIDHQQINGINTAELEKRMQDWDWERYFKDPDDMVNGKGKAYMKETFYQLNKITEGNNAAGTEIQQKLMFKYWPRQQMGQDYLESLSSIYERRRDFTPSEFGCCNAHLAYHILSGRLDDLYEKIRETGIDMFPGIDLYRQLEQELSQNPEQFQIEKYHNTPKYQSEFILSVAKETDAFYVETYKAIVTPYPEIEHSIIKGIDTSILEERMKTVAWHRDNELFEFSADKEPEIQSHISDIQEQMDILHRDIAGANIAVQLSIRYWIDATYFEDQISPEAWQYLDNLPKRSMEFPTSVPTKVAVNLLMGRPVAEEFVLFEAAAPDNWISLKFDKLGDPDAYQYAHKKGFSVNDIENLLLMVPSFGNRNPGLVQDLRSGDLVPITLRTGKEMLLEVGADAATLNFYTAKMQPVAVNINFDPDWKPPNAIAITTNNSLSEKSKLNKSPSKKTGKGPHP